ncbi:hypothetical protein BDP27DRAFT_1425865 [Rhodocollybia butyracea]|uniref:Uncharacterized protein n=1 Tax=Rhodocollybia butyracea TaxID=206335 RepID=A0A9P5PJ89_9AGAR|nr:hypothetical protein BDP27DRAFT_1425865 [Rhodocollybia butyracea]
MNTFFPDETQRRCAAARFLDLSAQEEEDEEEDAELKKVDWQVEWDDLEEMEEAAKLQNLNPIAVAPLCTQYDSTNNPCLFKTSLRGKNDALPSNLSSPFPCPNATFTLNYQTTASSPTSDATSLIRSSSPRPALSLVPLPEPPSPGPRFVPSLSAVSVEEEAQREELPLYLQRTLCEHSDQEFLLCVVTKIKSTAQSERPSSTNTSKTKCFEFPDHPITRRLIAAVYRSQLPVVYLQVPSMSNENMVIAPALPYGAKKSRFLSAGMCTDVPFAGNILRLEQHYISRGSVLARSQCLSQAGWNDGMMDSTVTTDDHITSAGSKHKRFPLTEERERPGPARFTLSAACNLASQFQDKPTVLWSLLGKPPKPPTIRLCMAECEDPISCNHNLTLKSFNFCGQSEAVHPDPTTFSAFTNALGEVLPAPEWVLCEYAASFAGSVAGGTARGYLSAVKSWHIRKGAGWMGGKNLGDMLQGIERQAPASSRREERLPAKEAYIVHLHNDLDLSGRNRLHLCVAAHAKAMWLGQMRASESLPISPNITKVSSITAL